MARMTWDDIGERFYETGVEQCALYLYDKYETDKTKCYHDGVPWNGLTGISEKPSGAEPTDLWANDAKYLTMISAEKFAASIEAYTWPEEFNECDGVRKLGTGLRFAQQQRKKFGLAYKSLIGNDEDGTDCGYKIHLMYGCLCAPSEKARKTVNDNPEAMTFTWEISTTPVPVKIAGYKFKATSYLEIDSRDFTGEKKVKLQMLEDILYGIEEFNGIMGYNNYLPLPEEVNTILAYDPPLQNIRIYTPPFKTKYKIGEPLELDGLIVLGRYQTPYGTFETVIDNEIVAVSGFDSATAGEKLITVTFENKTATFTVIVEDEPGPGPKPHILEKIEIIQQPVKTEYAVGEKFDSTGLEVEAFFMDGVTDIVTKSIVLNEPSTDVPGEEIEGTVFYTYDNVTKSASFSIRVVSAEKVLTGITITQLPFKKVYAVNEKFEVEGLEIEAMFSDGSKIEHITDPDFQYISPSTATVGESNGVVSYTYGKVTQSAMFSITVLERIVRDITITKYPDQIVYYLGEKFNPQGVEITVYYSDGSEKPGVTPTYIAETDVSQVAQNLPLFVYYTENDVTVSSVANIIDVLPPTVKGMIDVNQKERQQAAEDPDSLWNRLTYQVGLTHDEFRDKLADSGSDLYYVNAVYTDNSVDYSVTVDVPYRSYCRYYTNEELTTFDLNMEADYPKTVYFVYKGLKTYGKENDLVVPLEIAVKDKTQP